MSSTCPQQLSCVQWQLGQCVHGLGNSSTVTSSSQSGDTGWTEGIAAALPWLCLGRSTSVALLVRPGSNLCGLPYGSQSLPGCCMLSFSLQSDILNQCCAHPWHLGILRRSCELLFCSCWFISFQPSDHFSLFLCIDNIPNRFLNFRGFLICCLLQHHWLFRIDISWKLGDFV